MNLRDAILYMYSKIGQFLQMKGKLNLEIMYFNFIT